MLPATVDRHHGEQHMTARSKPEAASAADAPAHDQEESVVARIIEHIDGDAGDDDDRGPRRRPRRRRRKPAGGSPE